MYNRNWFFALGLLAFMGILLGFNTKPQIPNMPTDNYEKQWAEIDSLTSIGQIASARKLVNALYDRAKTESNYPQVVKSLMYESGFRNQLEENGREAALNRLEEEIKDSEGELQAVLQSLLATYYQEYLNSSYWTLQDRTERGSVAEGDPAVWTAGQFEERIADLYLASASKEAT